MRKTHSSYKIIDENYWWKLSRVFIYIYYFHLSCVYLWKNTLLKFKFPLHNFFILLNEWAFIVIFKDTFLKSSEVFTWILSTMTLLQIPGTRWCLNEYFSVNKWMSEWMIFFLLWTIEHSDLFYHWKIHFLCNVLKKKIR